MTNSRQLPDRPKGLCICHLSSVICHIRFLISRYPVLIGALFRALYSVSVGLDDLDETSTSGSSSEADLGQRVRELGRPLYRTFTRKDEGIVNKILTGVHDPRGIMIFGGVNCVLEYDGQHWTSIPIPNGGFIHALACDKSGTIYVGGTGELGALVLDGGAYRYKSYASLLTASESHFGQIDQIAVRANDVYFHSEKSLYRWNGQQFSVTHLPYEVGNEWYLTSFSGRLFVNAKYQPVSEVVGDHLEPFLDDPVLRETTVTGAIELANDKVLLITREKGIFELHDSSVASASASASSDKPSNESPDKSAKGNQVVPFKTDA